MDFFAVSFVVDIESRRDVRLLFAYHNGTHFYQTEGCCLLYLASRNSCNVQEEIVHGSSVIVGHFLKFVSFYSLVPLSRKQSVCVFYYFRAIE